MPACATGCFGGSCDAAHLLWTANTDDGAGHSGIPQRPRNRHLARRRIVAPADGAHHFHNTEIALLRERSGS